MPNKVEVSFDAHQGHVTLGSGPVTLAATGQRLAVTVTAPDLEALPQARHVIDKHLAIFAHREGFTTLDWDKPVEA